MNVTTLSDVLETLQFEQNEHDKRAHSDVLSWPLAKRLSHYTHHLGKYTAEVGLAALSNTRPSTQPLTDASIVCLAACNALKLKLANLIRITGTPNTPTELTQAMLKAHREHSKLSESFDHSEPLDYASRWPASFVDLLNALFSYTVSAGLNLPILMRFRWREVERRSR